MEKIVDLRINVELAQKVICLFLKEETEKFNFHKLVLGLSGGVDSALLAYLAQEALGKENIIAYFLPYRTSDPQSETDAQSVASLFGLSLRQIDISPMVDAYFQAIPEADKVRRGNKMARERMAILFDQAKAEGALVVGASNKSELLLGYSTWYGDMAASLLPFGDLYKTQIWQMAEEVGIPNSILSKAPSADLWPGQTDEGELGFSYALADQILYLLFDQRMRLKEVTGKGFSPELVNKIWQMVQKSQFKRKLPPICKLSARAIGWDLRYLRDWGR